MALCAAHKACAGFTYNSGDRGRARGEEEVLFKSLAENVVSLRGLRACAVRGVAARPTQSRVRDIARVPARAYWSMMSIPLCGAGRCTRLAYGSQTG